MMGMPQVDARKRARLTWIKGYFLSVNNLFI